MWLYILSFATPARSMPYTEGPTKSGVAAVNHRWAWRFWSLEYFVDRCAELKIDVAVCVMPMIDLRHCGNQHDYFIDFYDFTSFVRKLIYKPFDLIGGFGMRASQPLIRHCWSTKLPFKTGDDWLELELIYVVHDIIIYSILCEFVSLRYFLQNNVQGCENFSSSKLLSLYRGRT